MNHNSKILITGGNGFIASHLITTLLQQSVTVDLMVKRACCYTHGQLFQGDMTDASYVSDSVKSSDPEVIFHLAGFKERSISLAAVNSAIHTNLLGTLHLLSSALSLKRLKKIVILGTAEEYGQVDHLCIEAQREQSINAYSLTKTMQTHLAEFFARSHELPVVILRPSIIYGPKQNIDMFLPALITALITHQEFAMSPGMQTRDFLYIDDVIRALLLASQKPLIKGDILNISSGYSVKIADLALQVESILKKPGLIKLGALSYRSNEIMDYRVSNDKAKRLLGWQPQENLTSGLMKTIQYYLSQHST